MNTITKMVGLAQSNHGKIPEPKIVVRFPKGTSHREVTATLHRLAADVELATPPSAPWQFSNTVVG